MSVEECTICGTREDTEFSHGFTDELGEYICESCYLQSPDDEDILDGLYDE